MKVVEAGVPTPARETNTAQEGISGIFSVTQPNITITSPIATDIWAAGDISRKITWTTKGAISNNLSIYYSVNGDAWTTINSTPVSNSGTYTWNPVASGAVSDNVKIRIEDGDNSTISADSAVFKVLSGPTVTVTSPNGGESLVIGTAYDIIWNNYGEFNHPLSSPNKVKIEYIKYDASGNMIGLPVLIVDRLFNSGKYIWSSVNDDTCAKVKIRVISLDADYNESSVSDTSDGYFNIMLPSVKVTYPKGGETVYANGKYDITWTKDGAVDDLALDYSINNGTSWTNFATVSGAAAVAAGKYTWTVPDSLAGKSCLVQAKDPGRATTIDTSDMTFNVVAPTFALTVPKTGDSWVVGTDHSIIWKATGDHNSIFNNLKLQYSKDGTNFTDITIDPAKINYGTPDATGVANGSYLWTVVDAVSASGAAKIKIFDTTHTSTTATSTGFTIAPPSISVTAPKLGDKWIVGTKHDIAWTAAGVFPSNSLTFEYTTDGVNWTAIQGGSSIDAAAGSFAWDVPAGAVISDACKVRVTDTKRGDNLQFSSNIFSISVPTITVDYPKGGELVTLNDASEMIRWTTEGKLVGDLKLEYSLDNFASSAVTIATISNTLTEYPLFQTGVNYPLSATYRVRITDTGRPISMGKSSANFTVLPVPEITLTAPNGAENWIMGTQQSITWTDNGGKISNDLKFEYTVNGTNWFGITPNAPFDPTSHICLWTIPDKDIFGLFQSSFNNVRVRIIDNTNTATSDISDNVFNIKLPVIEITSPAGGEYWAAGDSAPVKWKTTGNVSNNLILYYSTDNGASWSAPITSGVANTDAYFWLVSNDPSTSVKFKIMDGERQNTLAISNAFNIIPKPTIALDSPKAGDTYVLGETMLVKWSTKGLSVGKLTLTYSADNFVTEKQVANNIDSAAGSYNWSIPLDALSSPNIKLKLTSENPNVDPVVSGAFRLRGGFTFTAPKLTDTWGAKSPQTIQWSTKGTIAKVNLDYSLNNGTSWNSVAGPVDNTGSYSWVLPDLVNSSCRLRITDSNDSTIYGEVDFKIDYYTISWRILDYDTYTDISTLSVKDALWSATEVDSPTGTIHKYPYGSYTTFWSKGTEYPERSTVWVANADKTVTVYLESAISAQIEWHVLLSTSYSAATDSLRVSSWLERRGKMVGLTDVERADLKKAVLQVYDGDTLVKELVSTTPDGQGVFSFNWDKTGLTTGKVSFVKAQIFYREGIYTSGGNIDVTAAKEQQAAKEELSAQLGVATSDIKSAVGDVKTAVETKAEEVKAAVAAVKAETGQILTATGTTLPAQITAVQEAVVKEIKPSVQSGILNRETSVKIGSSMTVSYRTTTGLTPVISIYDPKNVLKVASKTMKEIGATGVYEYNVKFENNWGIGDFTIVCSESTQGTADALAISVVRHDLEEISGQVSGILGTTSSLTGLGDIVDTLNSQFGLIEKALGNLGQGISGEVSKTKGVVNDLESVYNQLTALSGQIKKIGGTQGVSLEKLYKVSKDKKDDITYLKNKAQELKATMEINQKMMQNVANKPVVQSWFEFK
ncbi:MAG: hypothetical protein COV71_06630 [Candidatus Omnitrophica bacterium CG11_big_fil_rev_8_21_14_0_20_41_12]|nr:MAG: hypothetical protein COV71_06630 [Candidatus Omnitrophica bacterium CG11_big_fil_rev_8_21_14_0_20_41_12]